MQGGVAQFRPIIKENLPVAKYDGALNFVQFFFWTTLYACRWALLLNEIAKQ